MAKAAVEMAAWDLAARQQGVSLSAMLGGSRTSIESGVSIGIQDSLEELVERVAMERAAGYRRVKIKIKPGWDVAAVERIRDRFAEGPLLPLMVDANAAYTLADAPRLTELDRFELTMIEQPLDYDDIRDHARLQRQLRTPICLDESIHSVRAAAEAIDLGACRIINIKPGRVGGHAESLRLHDLTAAHGIPVWHGGMLESGIGRAHNIHLSTLPNFSLPGDVAASCRYLRPRPHRPRDRGAARRYHRGTRRAGDRGAHRGRPRRRGDRRENGVARLRTDAFRRDVGTRERRCGQRSGRRSSSRWG